MSTRYVVTGEPTEPKAPKAKRLPITLPDWLIPLLFGTFILGAFIWTPVGRKLAVAPIAKAARVSEKKVEEWLRG